ncbi:MAG: sulfatase [Oceanipulchritudo sp.]
MIPEKPNLLCVFSDQQSFDMLGCAGNPQIKTPNLDAFAGKGVRFEHAVANCPVCTPCRSMLLSGRHPLHNNCFDNDRRLLNRDEIGPGLGHVLRDAGYRMGYVGKWHLHGGDRDRPIPAGPDRQGFDDRFLSNNCHLNYHPDSCYYWTEDGEKVMLGQWEAAGQTEQALAFLDESTKEKPFCLFVSWHAPHNHLGGNAKAYRGFDAPEAFKARYNEDEIVPRGQLPNTAENRRMTLGYYALCSEVDHHFGRLMEKLEEKGFAENTLVVFTSDHGETFGAHAAQCHKGNPEDVSVRIPLLMRLPGVLSADYTSRLLIGMLDVPPTLLGLMGHEVPSNWEGLDLSPAIRNRNDDAVDHVPIFNFKPSWRGVYTRQYTFAMENIERTPDMHTRFGSDLPDQRKTVQNFNVLYDREEDPLQLNNLINTTGHLDTIWELTQRTHDWCAKFNDPFLSYKRLIDLVGDREDRTLIDLIAGVANHMDVSNTPFTASDKTQRE